MPTIKPDPIFAAIEAYKVGDAAWLARAHYEDELAGKGIKLAPAPDDGRTPELAALVNASIAARAALAQTVPTTPAGLAALLNFVAAEPADETVFLFDGDEESRAFVRSIAQAVRAIMPASS
jgi:hypothetical protein